MLQDGAQSARQLRPGAVYFRAMRHCQLPQQGPSGRREPDPYFTAVLTPVTPGNRTRILKPRDQLHGAVMLNEKPRCDLANGRRDAIGKPVYCEQ